MSNLHILVIEDDRNTSEDGRVLLRLHGSRVSHWFTAARAIEQVMEQQPALVVLDDWLDAPMDGWDSVQTLHGLPATVHIPVMLSFADHDVLRASCGGTSDRRRCAAQAIPSR